MIHQQAPRRKNATLPAVDSPGTLVAPNQVMNLRRVFAVLPLWFVAACATPVEIERPDDAREADLRHLQEIQQVFRAKNIGQHTFDFEGQGRVTVREITLDGFPGSTYLRCRFHFQNRTDKPVVRTWISLDVLDAEGRVVATQACNCIMPIPIPIARGSFYSDELRTPTYGAHLQPGWDWRIRCVSEFDDDEPLDPPPAERGTVKLPAPVIIKNRGQNGGKTNQ